MGAVETLRDFFATYRLYRNHHPRAYALASAYRIAIKNQPF